MAPYIGTTYVLLLIVSFVVFLERNLKMVEGKINISLSIAKSVVSDVDCLIHLSTERKAIEVMSFEIDGEELFSDFSIVEFFN